jgi:hypothetical protein
LHVDAISKVLVFVKLEEMSLLYVVIILELWVLM